MIAGATIVFLPRFDPQLLFDAVARYRITHLPGFPPVIKAIAHHPAAATADFSSVRFAGCSGAALAGTIQEEAARRLGCPVIQVYGMTETSGIITIDQPHRVENGSVGFPAPLCELRIVDLSTGAFLGLEAEGEVQVRGPHLMQGYLGHPHETAKIMTENGWLRTGDVGRFDGDGRLWLTGRIKELIKVHAAQVAPAELEMIIAEHPAIADVAVIGRPNGHCGEIPVAYVVWRERIDPVAVMEWVNDQLTPYKRVRLIETVQAIPRNATGKIDRNALASEDEARRKANSEKRADRAATGDILSR